MAQYYNAQANGGQTFKRLRTRNPCTIHLVGILAPRVLGPTQRAGIERRDSDHDQRFRHVTGDVD